MSSFVADQPPLFISWYPTINKLITDTLPEHASDVVVGVVIFVDPDSFATRVLAHSDPYAKRRYQRVSLLGGGSSQIYIQKCSAWERINQAGAATGKSETFPAPRV